MALSRLDIELALDAVEPKLKDRTKNLRWYAAAVLLLWTISVGSLIGVILYQSKIWC